MKNKTWLDRINHIIRFNFLRRSCWTIEESESYELKCNQYFPKLNLLMHETSFSVQVHTFSCCFFLYALFIAESRIKVNLRRRRRFTKTFEDHLRSCLMTNLSEICYAFEIARTDWKRLAPDSYKKAMEAIKLAIKSLFVCSLCWGCRFTPRTDFTSP